VSARVCSVLLVAIVVTHSGAATVAAAAAAVEGSAAAAAHYRQGRKLYQVAEYAQALDEFKKAYLAREDPAFLYNIAQCHRQLGDNRQAVTFYKRYLSEAPPNDPNRPEAEKLIKDLEAKTAAAPSPPPAPLPPEQPAAPPPAAPEPPPPVPGAAPAAPPAAGLSASPSPSAPGRSGLHLQFGLGGGVMRDDFSYGDLVDGNATGGAGSFHLVAAYGVSQRFAIGGTIALEGVQSPKVTIAGQRNDTVDVGTLGFFGVLGDFRLAADRPTGLHFMAALGAARMEIRDTSGAVSDHTPGGGGLMLGAGYDWRLSDQWQWGALARFLGLSLSDDNVGHRVEVFSLLLSASYR
jgi:hypothetical protein